MISISFRKHTVVVFISICLLTCFATSGFCQQKEKDTELFSLQNRVKFGNFLFSDKDYLRALNEYKEYLRTSDNDTVRYKFAECFFKIGRYEEALDNFKTLFYNSSFSDMAKLGFYKSVFFSKDFKGLRDYVIDGSYFPFKYEREVKRLDAISHLLDKSILPDTNRFFPNFDDSSRTDLRKFYMMKKYPEKKNPVTAALASAVIPGLGKIYTGEISDGITSFIATGLMVFLSANNFSHNHNFRGWLFTGLAAFSYAGSIYGSAASAQIYNARIQFNFDKEVKIYFEKRNYFLPEDD